MLINRHFVLGKLLRGFKQKSSFAKLAGQYGESIFCTVA